MAAGDKKISEFASLLGSTLVLGDRIEINDISEGLTSNQNKSITVEEFFDYAYANAYAAKAVPIAADIVIVGDSEDGWLQKKTTLTELKAALNLLTSIANAEMRIYDGTVTIPITETQVYMAVREFVTGEVNGWTFDAGRVVDANITSEADNTVVRIVTSGAHSLTSGDIVGMSNMNNAGHNGITAVTVINATTFDCDDITYVAGEGASAGVVIEPSYLEAGASAAGDYSCIFSISGEPADADTFKWEIYKNSYELDLVVAEREHSNNDVGCIMANGFLPGIVATDRIFITVSNETGAANDFTIKHANVGLHRL